MKGKFSIIVSVIILVIMGLLLYYSGGMGLREDEENVETVEDVESDKKEENVTIKISDDNIPLENWKDRITKKPFGILIDPETSPVQPELFSGYHTGTDFEVFEGEMESEADVRAICDGKLLETRYVSDYGGVIVQQCNIENSKVVVLYGHVDITSIKSKSIEGNIERGEVISVLADNESYYSGEERKHLHLGIVKGIGINYKGYVESKSSLVNWLDFEKISF